MPKDDQAARDERARHLREQIDKLDEPDAEADAKDAPAEDESPRDFIERRMREERDRED